MLTTWGFWGGLLMLGAYLMTYVNEALGTVVIGVTVVCWFLVERKTKGRWEWRWLNNEIGQMVDGNGRRQGAWALRDGEGTVATGRYVDGKMHGRWKFRYADRTVKCVTYENGELVKGSTTPGPCK